MFDVVCFFAFFTLFMFFLCLLLFLVLFMLFLFCRVFCAFCVWNLFVKRKRIKITLIVTFLLLLITLPSSVINNSLKFPKFYYKKQFQFYIFIQDLESLLRTLRPKGKFSNKPGDNISKNLAQVCLTTSKTDRHIEYDDPCTRVASRVTERFKI